MSVFGFKCKVCGKKLRHRMDSDMLYCSDHKPKPKDWFKGMTQEINRSKKDISWRDYESQKYLKRYSKEERAKHAKSRHLRKIGS